MRLAFCPSIGPFDLECDVDVSLDYDYEPPRLVINGVYEHSDKANLLHGDNKLLKDMAFEIADMAEDDEHLMARAIEAYADERDDRADQRYEARMRAFG